MDCEDFKFPFFYLTNRVISEKTWLPWNSEILLNIMFRLYGLERDLKDNSGCVKHSQRWWSGGEKGKREEGKKSADRT